MADDQAAVYVDGFPHLFQPDCAALANTHIYSDGMNTTGSDWIDGLCPVEINLAGALLDGEWHQVALVYTNDFGEGPTDDPNATCANPLRGIFNYDGVTLLLAGGYDVSDYMITQTEWIGVVRNDGKTNLTLAGNPANRGGGDRIFADRNHPIGTSGKDDLHNRVLVRATLDRPPAVGDKVTIRFRLFDPDHYSGDATLDPNGPTSPQDNVRAGEPISINTTALDPKWAT